MQSVGLVIPIYNVGHSLTTLMQSIEDCLLMEFLSEAVIVDDGSTDSSVKLAEKFIDQSAHKKRWRILRLPQNTGRFTARLQGAKSLTTDLVLFLDCRLELPTDFTLHLKENLKTHSCLMAHVEIDTSKSIFDLYWDRTHRWAFAKHYEDLEKNLWIDQDNYDLYLKGTGALLCSRTLFIEICSRHETPLHSDDTLLMKSLAYQKKIFVTPNFKVWWYPRRDFSSFLKRLFDRGPGFIEYHVFERQGLFFAVFIFSLVLFVSNLALLFVSPFLGLTLLIFLLCLLAASSFFFSHGFREAFRLMPLHVLSITSYFLGSVWGIFHVLMKPRRSKALE